MSRPAPFELVFREELEQWFAEIRSEATAVEKDPSDLAQFVTLSAAQHLVSDIESPELLAEHPAAANEYHILTYAGFHFWMAGKRVVELGDDFLAESPPSQLLGKSVTMDVPGGACYLRLPEQRFWARVDPLAPHEPLDGLFVVQSSDGVKLSIVAILGLRRERGGFSQISITVAREEMTLVPEAVKLPLFAPVMEGGTDAGFKSVTSVGELLLLANLALAHDKR